MEPFPSVPPPSLNALVASGHGSRTVANSAPLNVRAPVRLDPPPRGAGFQLDGGSLQAEDALLEQIAGLSNGKISRRDAMRVPAVLRARNVIAGVPATLPIELRNRKTRELDDRAWLGQDPDPKIEPTVTYAHTFEDLLFHSVSYWRVTRFSEGFPIEAEHVDHRAVSQHAILGMPSQVISEDLQFTPIDPVFIDGLPMPAREVIRFTSPNPPLLVHAARAIRTVLLLDEAAARYARDPMPLGYFSDSEDQTDPLEDDEITEVLNAWETARRKRVWGYISKGLQLNEMTPPTPEQLQLVESRQHAVLEIARATGLDPEDIGVSTTSRTYQNSVQRRLDLVDFVLMNYISGVQDRLSMRDVSPRDLRARFDVYAFTRADFKSRMEGYKIGIDAGVLERNEARRKEGWADLASDQEAAAESRSARAARQPREEPVMASIDVPAVSGNGHRELEPAFETDTAEIIHLDVEVDTPFRVDRTRRQITGLLVPWGATGQSGFSRWRFVRGSLTWSDVGRVKLLRDHDMGRAVGRALELTDREDGLHGTFSIARGDAGDEVLSLAEDGVLDGFSIGPRIPPNGWEIDRNDRDVRLVHSARLVEVTVTAIPAMDDARVKSVTMQQEGSQMGDTKVKPGTDPGGTGATVLDKPDAALEKFQDDLDARFKAVLDGQAESNKVQAEQIAGTISAAFDSAFTRLQGADAAGLGAAAAARFKVIKEPPVYRFDGDVMKASLVKDAWLYHRNGDFDARDRLRKFQDQQSDLVKFTQVNTTSAADVVPPGYRPDLFVTELMQGRPIVAQSSRGTISDATPFTVPRFVSSTDATQDHVEGTNPSIGTIVLDSTVVSPGAISGIFELTREIVDSSNPAIDAIALAAMRESWNQQTETKAYDALNGAAAVTEEHTLAELNDELNTSITTTRDLLARYPFTRFAAPSGAVISQTVTRGFSSAKDTTGRPLLPSIGAQNAAGLGNAVQQGWFVDGLPFVPAWAMTEGLSDDVSIITQRADWWTWESPLLTFRFEEKRGPAIIELALFGYYATHVLRNAGIFAIRLPAV